MGDKNPKKYKVKVVVVRTGDPTLQLGFKSLNGAIEELHVQAQIKIGSNTEEVVMNTTIPQLPDNEEALLMSVFPYEGELPSNGTIQLTLFLTTANGDTFELSSGEGVPSFTAVSDNEFVTNNLAITYNSELPTNTPLQNGEHLAIQSIDESGQRAFLVANNNATVSLSAVYNPYLNSGVKWRLLAEGNVYALRCKINGEHYFLTGDTNEGSVNVLQNGYSLWYPNHNETSNANVYGWRCSGNGGTTFLKANTGLGEVSLTQNYSAATANVNWFLHRLDN